jgi:hypothetical protein
MSALVMALWKLIAIPSCGKRVLSDHHNLIACGRSGVCLVRTVNPSPSCIELLCAV